eukprot:9331509-Alexandrium_andersonii.AAC.1
MCVCVCVSVAILAQARSESPASQRHARLALHLPPSAPARTSIDGPLASPENNRTALARREKYGRAHGRAVQLLLREFALTQQHRGGQLSRLGSALRRALS